MRELPEALNGITSRLMAELIAVRAGTVGAFRDEVSALTSELVVMVRLEDSIAAAVKDLQRAASGLARAIEQAGPDDQTALLVVQARQIAMISFGDLCSALLTARPSAEAKRRGIGW
jgi:hypothetical protein